MTKTLGISTTAALLLAVLAASPAEAAACLSGYHSDANGHCQPNNPLPQRHICPPGY